MDSTPEHKGQREDLTEHGQNKLESQLGDLHGAPSHTQKTERERQAAGQVLNGREGEEKREQKQNINIPRRVRRTQRLTRDRRTKQRDKEGRETDATDKTTADKLELTARKPSSRV